MKKVDGIYPQSARLLEDGEHSGFATAPTATSPDEQRHSVELTTRQVGFLKCLLGVLQEIHLRWMSDVATKYRDVFMTHEQAACDTAWQRIRRIADRLEPNEQKEFAAREAEVALCNEVYIELPLTDEEVEEIKNKIRGPG